ncbi:hypothetical protein DV515_00016072, partial [Chloebia gouldiae]
MFAEGRRGAAPAAQPGSQRLWLNPALHCRCTAPAWSWKNESCRSRGRSPISLGMEVPLVLLLSRLVAEAAGKSPENL